MNDTTAESMGVTEVKQEKRFNHPEAIFEYIRRRKGGQNIKVGVVLGLRVDDEIRIGWSKCNSIQDKFDPEVGIELARLRACKETPTTTPVPSCIRNQVRQMAARCVRYFKDTRKLEIPS